MRVIDIPQIEKLGVVERILLVEDLWDSISSDVINCYIYENIYSTS